MVTIGLFSCAEKQKSPEQISEIIETPSEDTHKVVEKELTQNNPIPLKSDLIEEEIETSNNKSEVVINSEEPKIASSSKQTETDTDIENNNFALPDSKNSQLYEQLINSIATEKVALNYQTTIDQTESDSVKDACKKTDAKLASVTFKECINSNLRLTPYSSGNNVPILLTEFPPLEGREPVGKVLLIGGTHGDELTSVSIVFKWIKILQQYHSGLFHWHIAPMMNPDGVLMKRATRPNARGIDLNRNMPTPDWSRLSKTHWEKINRDPRKNPGGDPASEPETRWLIHEIESFQPDAIISVHAPYGILDFDGPDLSTAPTKFGRLHLNLLGTYPGSLGNYAGINKDIPVLTLELPHAWVMPKSNEINSIWTDMVKWLKQQLTNKE